MGIFGNDDTVRRRKLAEPSFAASWSGVKRRLSIIHGDALEVLPTLSDIDAVVCDPPYHLQSIVKRFGGANAAPAKFGTDGAFTRSSRGFMGKQWDGGDIAFRPETWRLVLNAMKPGAHLLAFAGTRTQHRMITAIEDAGFEVRDIVLYCYGSGFPKSQDISKAIDKQAGAKRKVVGYDPSKARPNKKKFAAVIGEESEYGLAGIRDNGATVTAPATPEAQQWQGWGSALKPSVEIICVARKKLIGTLAQNVLRHGTGGLNIDACRVPTEGADREKHLAEWNRLQSAAAGAVTYVAQSGIDLSGYAKDGRWPANLVHDGSDEVLDAFAVFGERLVGGSAKTGRPGAANPNRVGVTGFDAKKGTGTLHNDSGTAARFYYTAKADADDRAWSGHPTIKPLDLMRWLVRLVTPPGGTVLDPFAGSGTTLEAAILENFNAIGIEREAEYIADIKRRLDPWSHMYHTGRRKLCD